MSITAGSQSDTNVVSPGEGSPMFSFARCCLCLYLEIRSASKRQVWVQGDDADLWWFSVSSAKLDLRFQNSLPCVSGHQRILQEIWRAGVTRCWHVLKA